MRLSLWCGGLPAAKRQNRRRVSNDRGQRSLLLKVIKYSFTSNWNWYFNWKKKIISVTLTRQYTVQPDRNTITSVEKKKKHLMCLKWNTGNQMKGFNTVWGLFSFRNTSFYFHWKLFQAINGVSNEISHWQPIMHCWTFFNSFIFNTIIICIDW